MYVKKIQMQLVSMPLPRFESTLIVKEEQDKTCSRLTSLCLFLFRYETYIVFVENKKLIGDPSTTMKKQRKQTSKIN